MRPIRIARADELPILAEIERVASELLAGWVPVELTTGNVPPGVLEKARRAGRLFVAVDDGDRPIGFALVILVDGVLHLEEIDVLPSHGKKGHGSRLIEAVCSWAQAMGHGAITLSTYTDVPWNAPFYRRLGFRELGPGEIGPGLARVLEREREKGYPMERRVVMRRDLAQPLPACVLNNGLTIPRIGLGVFRTGPGRATRDAVSAALSVGYRHVDTARIYGNEVDVGEAVRASGLPRHELFVTTKLWNDDQGYDTALRAFDASLGDLGLEYVDLYLVHWPVPGKRRDSWRALERLYEEGRCRAIGVSNFMVRHLDELAASANVVPAVNQIELHPFLQQRDVVERCRALGIAVEAYSPLTKGRRLDDPELTAVARAAGRTPAQVLVRWSLQEGFVVLPKSASPERIAQNFQALDFELGPELMARLDVLDQGLHTAWDPSGVP